MKNIKDQKIWFYQWYQWYEEITFFVTFDKMIKDMKEKEWPYFATGYYYVDLKGKSNIIELKDLYDNGLIVKNKLTLKEIKEEASKIWEDSKKADEDFMKSFPDGIITITGSVPIYIMYTKEQLAENIKNEREYIWK